MTRDSNLLFKYLIYRELNQGGKWFITFTLHAKQKNLEMSKLMQQCLCSPLYKFILYVYTNTFIKIHKNCIYR